MILVVDVGGGTTDFSAIAALEKDGSLELARVAVGDHILLGGDNMDLALAHVVRMKLEAQGKEIDRWQMVALTHACRVAKETLLTDLSVASAPVVIASRGSKLLGGGMHFRSFPDRQREGFRDGQPIVMRLIKLRMILGGRIPADVE